MNWKVDHEFICTLPDGKDGDWLVIARMPASEQMIDKRNDALAWAKNAKLMAAAPQLLEALELAENALENVTSERFKAQSLDFIRKTIAKATK